MHDVRVGQSAVNRLLKFAADPSPFVSTVVPPVDPGAAMIAEARAARWIATEAETIPGVRKALHVIVGTISRLHLSAWRGDVRVDPSVFPWLTQPDPDCTSVALLSSTLRDGIWHDRAYWRRLGPGRFRRVDPARVVPVHDPGDVDAAPTHLIDGKPVPADELAVFTWSGLGGLRRFGAPLLDMYLQVMGAASRFADEPVPSVVLKNTSGMDLLPDEVDTLLAAWEAARTYRRTAYLNSAVELQVPGYSARDLQLAELTELIVRDVARMFGLPAHSLGVSAGDSQTYANVTEERRDEWQALQPWASPIEATLSMNTLTYHVTDTGVTTARAGRWVPYGTDVRFDLTDHLRDPFPTRVAALTQAIAAVDSTGAPFMTAAEARALEPTIPTVTPEATP